MKNQELIKSGLHGYVELHIYIEELVAEDRDRNETPRRQWDRADAA